ncbi:hypothetical protein TWF132_011666 [Orbilia oligospora]|nr:hypothetical protein TWF132_011666 [Orbilia oligospora]
MIYRQLPLRLRSLDSRFRGLEGFTNVTAKIQEGPGRVVGKPSSRSEGIVSMLRVLLLLPRIYMAIDAVIL